MTEITFRTAKLESGKLIIDIPMDQRGAVMKFLRTKKDRPYDLTIKEHREKRSLDANAYAWVLIGKIADALRITPKEIYRQAIFQGHRVVWGLRKTPSPFAPNATDGMTKPPSAKPSGNSSGNT